MTAIAPLTTYREARADLLAAAEAAGAVLGSHRHPGTGPDGGPLATDVARFGAAPGEADEVVLVLSGVHGVEGHAGSALQRDLIASGRLGALPARTAVVLVHAANPYGMAWWRRVDAANIDVNRNFVDFADLPANPLYGEVDHLLNPTRPTLDLDDTSFVTELFEFYGRVGDHVGMKTLNGGQYDRPTGVQFGGQEASWTRRTLEAIWTEHLAGARTAVNLDIHTGLGPMGRLTVFQTADPHEPAAERGRAWYPEHLYCAPRTQHDPIDHGLLGPGFDTWAAGRAAGPGGEMLDTATFVVEFGTLDVVHGVTAFRADNWLHHHGDPASEQGRRIARLMQEMFFVDDEGWRTQVADQGEMALHTALDALATPA